MPTDDPDVKRMNVDDALDDSPVRPFHILVVTLCGLVTLIDGYDLVGIGEIVDL